MRYSYFLELPITAPFDKSEYRWPTFLGEFVLPLVKSKPQLLFWFSNYGPLVRFRVHLNGTPDFEHELIALQNNLGIKDTNNEIGLTLKDDLGGIRFRSVEQLFFCKIVFSSRLVFRFPC